MYNYKKTKFIPSLLSLVSLAIITLGQIQPIACAQKSTKIVLNYGDTKRKEITLFKKKISVKELIDIAWEALLVEMDKKVDEGAIRTYLDIDEDADLSEEVFSACVFIKREFDNKDIKYVLPPTYVLNLEEKKMFKEFGIDQEIPISICSVTHSDMVCSRNEPSIREKYDISDDTLVEQVINYNIENLISEYTSKPQETGGKNFITKELSERVKNVSQSDTEEGNSQHSNSTSESFLTMNNATKAIFLLGSIYVIKEFALGTKKKKKRRRRRKRVKGEQKKKG